MWLVNDERRVRNDLQKVDKMTGQGEIDALETGESALSLKWSREKELGVCGCVYTRSDDGRWKKGRRQTGGVEARTEESGMKELAGDWGPSRVYQKGGEGISIRQGSEKKEGGLTLTREDMCARISGCW